MYKSEFIDMLGEQGVNWGARELWLAYVMPSISLPRMWSETAATLPNSTFTSTTNEARNSLYPVENSHIHQKHVDHKLVRNLPCLYQEVFANRTGRCKLSQPTSSISNSALLVCRSPAIEIKLHNIAIRRIWRNSCCKFVAASAGTCWRYPIIATMRWPYRKAPGLNPPHTFFGAFAFRNYACEFGMQ
jgi:hypothetical protein